MTGNLKLRIFLGILLFPLWIVPTILLGIPLLLAAGLSYVVTGKVFGGDHVCY